MEKDLTPECVVATLAAQGVVTESARCAEIRHGALRCSEGRGARICAACVRGGTGRLHRGAEEERTVTPEAILELSAAQLARAIREKRVTSVAATEAALARMKAVHPRLNCLARSDDELALAAARLADQDLARGALRGPLHGVPMAHKDMYYRRGVISACGSKILSERPAPSTATVLERLDAAGAIQFGVLNMVEFAFGPTGHNWHTGHCRNAWDPARITGGSSSGSAPRWPRARRSPRSAPTPADRSGCRRTSAESRDQAHVRQGVARAVRCRYRSRSTPSGRSLAPSKTVHCCSR
jgi:hypothetical protein